MQWTTGDRSDGFRGLYGFEALAGINTGDRINFITIPGSRSSSIINIDTTSNIGIPGTWMFKLGTGIHLIVIMPLPYAAYLKEVIFNW